MTTEATWTLYIIGAANGALYTGITTDPERRFAEHASGKGAKFFRGNPPQEIVYREEFPNRSEASRREAEVKALSRGEKLRLIAQG